MEKYKHALAADESRLMTGRLMTCSLKSHSSSRLSLDWIDPNIAEICLNSSHGSSCVVLKAAINNRG